MFSAVFVFQVFQLLKVPNKFWENYIKIKAKEPSRITKGGPEGGHQGSRRPGGAAPP